MVQEIVSYGTICNFERYELDNEKYTNWYCPGKNFGISVNNFCITDLSYLPNLLIFTLFVDCTSVAEKDNNAETLSSESGVDLDL